MRNWHNGDWHLEAQMQYSRELHARAFGAALLEIGREIGDGLAWTAARLIEAGRGVAGELARRRLVRTTTRELAALDDRALNDIGLHRSEIPWVAAETARMGGAPRDLHEVRGRAAAATVAEDPRRQQVPVGLLRHQPAGCG